jgi:hypothetical protein
MAWQDVMVLMLVWLPVPRIRRWELSEIHVYKIETTLTKRQSRTYLSVVHYQSSSLQDMFFVPASYLFGISTRSPRMDSTMQDNLDHTQRNTGRYNGVHEHVQTNTLDSQTYTREDTSPSHLSYPLISPSSSPRPTPSSQASQPPPPHYQHSPNSAP